MAAIQKAACEACGRASTTRCAGCIEGLDHYGQPSPTYYCNKTCQKAHWTEHKADCKLANTRKVLYRGGELLQKAFYTFRDVAFDLKITSVTKQGEALIVHDQCIDMSQGPLFRFPDRMVADEVDKKSILTLNACNDAPAYLHELSKKVFQGVSGQIQQIKEVRLLVDEKKCRSVKLYRNRKLDDSDYFHEVIKVALSDSAAYALDLAGAQYGQLKSVIPFEDYARDYVTVVCSEFDHGWHANDFRELLMGKHDLPAGYDVRIPLIAKEVTQALNYAVQDWEEENETVSHMLDQKQPVFASKLDNFLGRLRDDIRAYVHHFESNGSKFSILSASDGDAGKPSYGDAIKTKETAKRASPSLGSGTSSMQEELRRARFFDPVTEPPKQLTEKELRKNFAGAPKGVQEFVAKFAAGGGKVHQF
ncbi:hypothetical protein LTR36_006518 [Oleoguttula mirabilis]|uniref:MYND-type domain-containing protein n=1 Tax=Oleoguttula mirabilis TaxID=1507867 RepID=A0AAV9JV20_9PEZI|nr:hypothetical protein LTR36_006518 [Oleoguttula mirabilis]